MTTTLKALLVKDDDLWERKRGGVGKSHFAIAGSHDTLKQGQSAILLLYTSGAKLHLG